MIEFGDVPFAKKVDDKWRCFRNNVIHNGQIPTKIEAIEYGDYIRKLIISIMVKLKEKYSKEIQEITFENIKTRAEHNKNECAITTMCNPNIVSLVNGNLEESLNEDFVSQINVKRQIVCSCWVDSLTVYGQIK